MKLSVLRSALSVIAFLTFGILCSQVPDSGIVMNATSGTTYLKIGSVTLSEVAVTGQSFTKALRITTGSNIINSWDAQVQYPTVSGISTGDVVLVAFYARTVSSLEETGEGSATVIIENKTTYVKD